MWKTKSSLYLKKYERIKRQFCQKFFPHNKGTQSYELHTTNFFNKLISKEFFKDADLIAIPAWLFKNMFSYAYNVSNCLPFIFMTFKFQKHPITFGCQYSFKTVVKKICKFLKFKFKNKVTFNHLVIFLFFWKICDSHPRKQGLKSVPLKDCLPIYSLFSFIIF